MGCKNCNKPKAEIEVYIHYKDQIYLLGNYCFKCVDKNLDLHLTCFACGNHCYKTRPLFIHFKDMVAKIGYVCTKCDPKEKERQQAKRRELYATPEYKEKFRVKSLNWYYKNKLDNS